MSMTTKEFEDAQKEIMNIASEIDFANLTPWQVYKLGMKHGIDLATRDIE